MRRGFSFFSDTAVASTVASVRAANVRVTFAHDGSADELEGLSQVIAVAAKSRVNAKAAKDVNPEGDSAD